MLAWLYISRQGNKNAIDLGRSLSIETCTQFYGIPFYLNRVPMISNGSIRYLKLNSC